MITFLIFMIIMFSIIELILNINIKMMAICLLLCLLLALLSSFTVNAYEYSPSDMVLIGKVMHHEAGNQSELGKRLVIDTILNRVESPSFPNTVSEVINQPGQYCNPKEYPPDGTYRLVAEEIYSRTNNKVLWYKTKNYHSYGVPIIKEGAHYFSGR